jgi:hypothetical protein
MTLPSVHAGPSEAEIERAAVDEDGLREVLRARIGWHGGKRVFAKELAAELGVSQGYLSDVLNGNRGIADRLAEAAGYERVVMFRPLPPSPGGE